MTPSSSVNSNLSGYSADEPPSRIDRFSGQRQSSSFDDGDDVLDAIARKPVRRQPSSSSVARRPLNRELGRSNDDEEDEHRWVDSNTDLIKPGALRQGPPDERAYEELDRAIAELPIAYADDSPVKTRRGHAAADASIDWAAEDDSADPWASSSSREIESADAVAEREAAEARNERRRRRIRKLARLVREDDESVGDLQQHFRSSTTSSTATVVLSTGQILRRGRALRELGMDTDSEVDPAPHPDYSDREDDDDFHAVVPRDHDYALQGERGTDWWPVTVAARIHPRTVALRASVAANFALIYVRFLFVLFVALIGAIWQVRRVLFVRAFADSIQGPRAAKRAAIATTPERKRLH